MRRMETLKRGTCKMKHANRVSLCGCLSDLTQGIYDQAIGFITVAFFATAVCTCGYRRRRFPPTITVEEEVAQIQPMRPRNVSFLCRGNPKLRMGASCVRRVSGGFKSNGPDTLTVILIAR